MYLKINLNIYIDIRTNVLYIDPKGI